MFLVDKWARPSAKGLWSHGFNSFWRSVIASSDRPPARSARLISWPNTSELYLRLWLFPFSSICCRRETGIAVICFLLKPRTVWCRFNMPRCMSPAFCFCTAFNVLFLGVQRNFGAWLDLFLRRRRLVSRKCFVSVGFYYWKNCWLERAALVLILRSSKCWSFLVVWSSRSCAGVYKKIKLFLLILLLVSSLKFC